MLWRCVLGSNCKGSSRKSVRECRRGNIREAGGNRDGLFLTEALMRLTDLCRGPRTRGWATPRPTFREKSVQICVFQDQACHRHVTFISLNTLSILKHYILKSYKILILESYKIYIIISIIIISYYIIYIINYYIISYYIIL